MNYFIIFLAEEVLYGHRDYQQVVLDVNRSLKRFPPGECRTDHATKLSYMKSTLLRINETFSISNPGVVESFLYFFTPCS